MIRARRLAYWQGNSAMIELDETQLPDDEVQAFLDKQREAEAREAEEKRRLQAKIRSFRMY